MLLISLGKERFVSETVDGGVEDVFLGGVRLTFLSKCFRVMENIFKVIG